MLVILRFLILDIFILFGCWKMFSNDMKSSEPAFDREVLGIIDRIIKAVAENGSNEGIRKQLLHYNEKKALLAGILKEELLDLHYNEAATGERRSIYHDFCELHRQPTSMYVMVQTGFTFLTHPVDRHILANVLWAGEMKIHKDNKSEMLLCLRQNCGSNAAVKAYLDFIPEFPELKWYSLIPQHWELYEAANVSKRNYLEYFGGQMTLQAMNDANGNKENIEVIPAHGPQTTDSSFLDQTKNLFRNVGKLIKKLFGNFTSQVYIYIYEMVNDILLWLYLRDRIPFLQGLNFIIGLIWFQFSTIFLAHSIMGIYIVFKVMYSDSEQILPKPESKGKRVCLYILLFLTAPFVPCALAIRVQGFRERREKLVKKEQEVKGEESVQKKISSRTWLKAHELDNKIEVIEAAIATFHFIAATFNTIPELMMLLIFLGTQNDGEVVVIQDNEYLFWINTCTGMFSTLYALVGATSLQKRGQLDLGQKMTLLFSYFFQVLSRLSLLVGTSLYTMDHIGPSSTYHLLFLLVPILIHWLLVGLINHFWIEHFKKLSLPDRIIHILSNTFIAVPLSNMDLIDQQNCIACDLECEEEQEQRSTELKLLLGSTGLELLLCWTVAFGLGFWSRADNFQTGLWFSPLISWAFGCLFLGYYYRFKHTWCFWRRKELLQENKSVEATQDSDLGKMKILWITLKNVCVTLVILWRFELSHL